MSYNNNGNNNDNRKGKGNGKKNKRKRNQLTPVKNPFTKSQSQYSPNSPPKHGTKARCIHKQGKKVKEFIKKGTQAQSFIFGNYAFAGYSDDETLMVTMIILMVGKKSNSQGHSVNWSKNTKQFFFFVC